ncbi:MAG: serine/threonine-protein kinase, partial [Anaerolineae bacterium]
MLREYLPASLSQRSADHQLTALDPSAEGAWQDGLEAFTARARRLARLDHPGLAPVLRLIEANGTVCMLSPWYPGEALTTALPGRQDAGGTGSRDLVLALMDALAYLHEHGQAHGAISPERIRVDAEGAPVLLPGHEYSGTEDAYAAPEQLQGRQTAGPAADLYRLAASLYRALTGVEPPTALQRQAALQDGLPDPLESARQYLPPARYGGLADALDQGLALDPGQRPSSAEQWRRAFASIDWRLHAMRDAPDTATTEERDRLPLVVFVVLLVLVAAAGLYLLQGGEVRLPGSGPGALDGSPRTQQPAPRPALADEEERRQWQAALQADTVMGYRRFIERYPDSIYRDQAQVQLNILDEQAWEKLSAEDTRPAYEEYLQQFPAGLHEAAALRRIEQIDAARAAAERRRLERERQDNEAWDAARAERSIASMQGYIDEWPAGLHIEEAQRTLRQLLDRRNDDQAYEAARALDKRDAYQSYLDAFPGGAHVTAALQAIDDLTLRPGKAFRDCPECPEMVVVPAGSFLQGADDNDPL